jgi:hypothetical protein
MAWKPGSLEEMRRWQTRLRARLRTLVGGLSGPRAPLQAAIHETRDFRGYRRETVRFQSRPGLEVFGYFLIPANCPPRRPAILCLPGHGRGVDSIVGIAEDNSQRKLDEPAEYQKDFALQCVAHGYPAFAIEQISFGHRRDAEAQRAGGSTSSCTRDSMAALMLGETMTGWRVWDAMRALDYMVTRPEVDPQRLATMGISGGGMTSLFTACLDTRVQVAVVSGYLNTFRDSILAVNHCVDNYVPGLLKVVEMPDMAGLIAPRALFAESGTKDPIFPLPAFEQAVARLREIYAAFGVPERFGWEVFEGDHQFHGVGAFAFLKKYLS